MSAPFKHLAVLTLGALAAIPAATAQDTDAPWSMAEDYYNPDAFAAAREKLQHSHGAMKTTFIQADRLEYQVLDDEELFLLDANAWYGGDINKLWIKAEAEYLPEASALEEAEVQALWSRAVSPYFDVQAGLRQDFEPDGRTHAVLGLQGLAPYLFEVDAAAFLSTQGDFTVRIETEYELVLTQRLILQPRAELGLSAQDVPELEIGSGVTTLDAGLRLRYEVVREFAPYVGIEWQKRFGETADFLEAAGESPERTALVIGIRAWY